MRFRGHELTESKYSTFTRHNSFIKRAALALLLAAVAGCSNGELSRRTAAAKIREYLDAQGTYMFAFIGRIGAQCGYNPEDGRTWDMNPDHDGSVALAVRAGYAAVTPDGQDYWRVSFTRDGERSGALEVKKRHVTLKGCDYALMKIPVAKPVFVRVTGIVPSGNLAAVEYEWKWELTDLGRDLRANGNAYSRLNDDDRRFLREWFFNYNPLLPLPVPSDAETAVRSDKALFMKYDDGWRLQLSPSAEDH